MTALQIAALVGVGVATFLLLGLSNMIIYGEDDDDIGETKWWEDDDNTEGWGEADDGAGADTFGGP